MAPFSFEFLVKKCPESYLGNHCLFYADIGVLTPSSEVTSMSIAHDQRMQAYNEWATRVLEKLWQELWEPIPDGSPRRATSYSLKE